MERFIHEGGCGIHIKAIKEVLAQVMNRVVEVVYGRLRQRGKLLVNTYPKSNQTITILIVHI